MMSVLRRVALGAAALLVAPVCMAVEVTGYVGADVRAFLGSPQFDTQRDHSASLVFQPELYGSWFDDRVSLIAVPFLRLDSSDAKRSHFDVRELLVRYVADRFEVAAGFGKVFWGVTESRHLVDVINQTDLVENIDGEDKLGQPMVNLSLIFAPGTLDLFVLPGFRERTFPGPKGRLRSQPSVDADRALYESSRENAHVDGALRWSQTAGDWDFGLSHFYGTSREPEFVLGSAADGAPVLLPRYDLIHQTGIDVQTTKGNWLWKFEGIRRSGQSKTFAAFDAGFEYTFYGVNESQMDVGVLAEYLHDTRGSESPHPFENDVFAGARLVLNDEQSSEVLAGFIRDANSSATAFSVEASRRLGDRWKVELQLRLWSGVPSDDALSAFRGDDYLELSIQRFF